MTATPLLTVAALLGLKCINTGAVSYLGKTDVQFVRD
jgi:hypothetical protein